MTEGGAAGGGSDGGDGWSGGTTAALLYGSLEWMQEWATCVPVRAVVVAVSSLAALASLTTVCGMVAGKRDLRSTRDRLLLGLLLANALYVTALSPFQHVI